MAEHILVACAGKGIIVGQFGPHAEGGQPSERVRPTLQKRAQLYFNMMNYRPCRNKSGSSFQYGVTMGTFGLAQATGWPQLGTCHQTVAVVGKGTCGIPARLGSYGLVLFWVPRRRHCPPGAIADRRLRIHCSNGRFLTAAGTLALQQINRHTRMTVQEKHPRFALCKCM